MLSVHARTWNGRGVRLAALLLTCLALGGLLEATHAAPGVTVSTTELTVQEGGQESFTVVLDQQPSATVYATIHSFNSSVALVSTPDGNHETYAKPNSTTSFAFDASDWNTPKAVRVHGQALGTAEVILTISTLDPAYQGVAVPSVSVTVTASAPPPKPVVTITAGSGVTEGTDATFTLSASPKPASSIDVSVAIAQSGNFVTTGTQMVSIGASGTAALAVRTTDDSTDEADGSVTATVKPGSGYSLGSSSTATVTISDNDDPPKPVVTITAGSGVTEGTDATFTLSASPVPASALTVNLAVAQSGDYAASGTTGSKTVTIPTSGSATYTVSTVDDSADEADGSVTVTAKTGSGYTVHGVNGAATVTVADNDDPPAEQQSADEQTKQTCATPTGWSRWSWLRSKQTQATAPQAVRDLATRAVATMEGRDTLTWSAWIAAVPGWGTYLNDNRRAVRDELNRLETCRGGGTATTPEISVSAGTGVTEGTAATFTISVSPKPTSSIDVSVTITQSGSFVTTGTRTVSVGTSGSATLSVTTIDDSTDEPNGSVTATVQTGSGYTIGSPSTATVTVSDNDDPPEPTVTITAGSDVTEGANATFTVSASPEPKTSLSVSVAITQSGDFVTTGTRTVSVGTSGSATLSVATTDDSAYELDGSVTATVQSSSSYTVGNPSTATVAVADNDLGLRQSLLPLVTIAAGADVTEGTAATFTVTRDQASSSSLTVTLSISESTADGSHAAAGATGSGKTVTIAANQTSATYSVSTVNDRVAESDGTITATLTADSAYEIGSPTSASVAVADDEPTFTVTADSVVVTEKGFPRFRVHIDKTSSGQPDIPIRIKIRSVGSFTILPTGRDNVTDYDPSRRWQYYLLYVKDDQRDEPNGSMTFEIAPGTGYHIGNPFQVTTLIRDDDGPPVTYPPDPDRGPRTLRISGGHSKTEGGKVVFTIHSTAVRPASSVSVKVRIEESGSFAKAGQTGERTVVLTNPADNRGAVNLVVETVDDANQEAHGSITATILSGSGYSVGKLSSASITVLDDDAPVVTLAPGADVDEGDSATFTLTVAPPHSSALSVNLKIADTASRAATGQTGSKIITIPANTASATYSVGTAEDTVGNAHGSITATITAASAAYYHIGTPSAGTVLVWDDDVPRVTIQRVLGSHRDAVVEGAPAQFKLTAVPAPKTALSVQVNISHEGDGIAAGEAGLRTVSIPVSGTLIIDVDTDDDDVDEKRIHTRIDATLKPKTGYRIGDPSSAYLLVLDNDNTLIISTESIDIDESGSGSSGTYTLRLTNAPSDVTHVDIELHNPNPDAIKLSHTSLRFWYSDYDTPQTVTVTAVQDADETDETVTITHRLNNKNLDTVTVNVDDNLAAEPEMTIAAGPAVTEGEAATFTVSASLAPLSDLTINLSVTQTGSFAASGATGTGKTVTILANKKSATYSVSTVDDSTKENAGKVTATLTTGTGYTLGTPTSASVKVEDNEPFVIVTPADMWVSERYAVQMHPLRALAQGTAADAEALRKITAKVSLPFSPGSSNRYRGIQLKQRNDFCLQLGTDPGDGQTVTITVPLPTDLEFFKRWSTSPPLSGASSVTDSQNASFKFTGGASGNWGSQQCVVVLATRDPDMTDDTGTITMTVANYGTLTSVSSTYTVYDDHWARMTVNPGTLTLTEGGSAKSYHIVRLYAQQRNPNTAVAIAPKVACVNDGDGDDDGDGEKDEYCDTSLITVSRSTYTFTLDGTEPVCDGVWICSHPITVTPGTDADYLDAELFIEHTVTNFHGYTGPFYLPVTLEEPVGIVQAFPSSLSLFDGEGSGAVHNLGDTLNVRLRSDPGADITVAVRCASSKLSCSSSSLTFTHGGAGNWGSYQQITVSPVHDADSTDHALTIVLAPSGSGMSKHTSVQVMIEDDD